MGVWTDLATWRGPTVNQSGPMVEQRGLVLHIAEGSYEGTISWQKNPAAQVSSHFVIDLDGTIAQVVDTDITAWTQAAGNGHWLSAENAGFHDGQFTPQQVEANARLLAKAHLVYGVPLQLANDPSGFGLGHHGMGGTAWGGHFDCPGPANVALKQLILDRAIAIVNGDDDMALTHAEMADIALLALQGTDSRGNPVDLPPAVQNALRDRNVMAVEGRLTKLIQAVSAGDVDVKELADELAAELTSHEEFLATIANAVVDEERDRLAQ